MKKKTFLLMLLSLCLALTMVFAVGCGDDDDDDDDDPTGPISTPVDVTGRWEISGPGLGLNVLHLTQTGQTITGTVDRAAPGGGWDNGEITSGSNINNVVNITIVYDDMQTLELTGNITSATHIEGTYRSYYDPAEGVDEGAWSGDLKNE